VFRLSPVYTEGRRAIIPAPGLTEAGMASKGIVASTAAMAVLLQQGIENEHRSAYRSPGAEWRSTAKSSWRRRSCKTMGLRSFSPLGKRRCRAVAARRAYFSSVGGQDSDLPPAHMPSWREAIRGREMTVAVMGCVVNGPANPKMANNRHQPAGYRRVPVRAGYVDGQKTVTLKGRGKSQRIQQIVADTCAATYGTSRRPASEPERRSIGISTCEQFSDRSARSASDRSGE